MRYASAYLGILIMFWSSVAIADETVSIKVGYQSTAISGQFAGIANGLGTHVDMNNDLGFKRSNNVTAEMALQMGNSRLSLGYLPLNFKGRGTLSQTINFNGQSFSANTVVNSQVKADVYDLAYTYYLINMNNIPSRFQLGIEPSVKVIHVESSMSSATATRMVSATVPIPTIGLRARIALADFFGVVGRIGYMSYGNNHFLDADGQVEFSPVPLFGLYAGYRKMELKVDTSGAFLDAHMEGPYVGAFFRF